MTQAEAWKVLIHWGLSFLAAGNPFTTLWKSLGWLPDGWATIRKRALLIQVRYQILRKIFLYHQSRCLRMKKQLNQPTESFSKMVHYCCFKPLSFGWFVKQQKLNDKSSNIKMAQSMKWRKLFYHPLISIFNSMTVLSSSGMTSQKWVLNLVKLNSQHNFPPWWQNYQRARMVISECSLKPKSAW